VSLQNIGSELDAREMEAWQKLIRVLTHEIMNSISPITSLSGTLHNLVRSTMESEASPAFLPTLEEGLDAIRKRSEGLLGFTDVYRKFRRIPTPVLKPTNILSLMRRMQLLFHDEVTDRAISLVIDAQDEELLIDGDLCEQVFVNLIRNAIDALKGHADPEIRLSYSTTDNRSVITVSDHGEGIEPDKMESIFVPFFTTKKSGSGIGLAITKQIVLSHGATIKVNSAPGKGAAFTIYL
jgi:signal transduction histidine kinase